MAAVSKFKRASFTKQSLASLRAWDSLEAPTEDPKSYKSRKAARVKSGRNHSGKNEMWKTHGNMIFLKGKEKEEEKEMSRVGD